MVGFNAMIKIPWIDVEGIKHELIDFKGKHIYIHFFSSLNYMSLKEMEIIEQLANKYNAIQFGMSNQFYTVTMAAKLKASIIRE